MAWLTEEMKTKAEVYHGDQICREKLTLLLTELGMPNALLTPQEIEEYGFVKGIGLVWFKHRNKTTKLEHKVIDNIVISFDTVVTAYVEPHRIKKLTGVRAKEFLLWLTLSEIHVRNNEKHKNRRRRNNNSNSNDDVGSSSSSSSEGSSPEHDEEEHKQGGDGTLITFKTPVGLSRSFPVSVFE